MPIIPPAIFGILAAVRLGAMHTVVFGTFASNSLAQGINVDKPKLILTASCAIEGTKGLLEYRPLVEGALKH